MVSFKCSRCETSFQTEGSKHNHQKTCGGATSDCAGKTRSDKCNTEITKASLARHNRACTAGKERMVQEERSGHR